MIGGRQRAPLPNPLRMCLCCCTGLQQGAGRIAAGPRTVQGILQKLQRRIEEQRLQALLEEQQDTPVDVQARTHHPAPTRILPRCGLPI